MSEVKRYWPEEIVGTGELVVYAQDYAALEAQRDKLAGELEAIKGQQPVAFYWQDIGYPEPRTHGPHFGQPSESAMRNVDGRAIPVLLYTLPPAERDQDQPQ